MMVLVLLSAALLTYLVGRLMVRVLGWPRDLDGAMRWAMSLVVVAVTYTGLPELLALLGPLLPEVPRTTLSLRLPLPEVLSGVALVGLGILGYVAWRGGPNAEKEVDTRNDVRKRALPPAPNPGGGPTFNPLQPPPDGGA